MLDARLALSLGLCLCLTCVHSGWSAAVAPPLGAESVPWQPWPMTFASMKALKSSGQTRRSGFPAQVLSSVKSQPEVLGGLGSTLAANDAQSLQW